MVYNVGKLTFGGIVVMITAGSINDFKILVDEAKKKNVPYIVFGKEKYRAPAMQGSPDYFDCEYILYSSLYDAHFRLDAPASSQSIITAISKTFNYKPYESFDPKTEHLSFADA